MALHVSCAAMTYVLGKWAADAFADPEALVFARSVGAALFLLALSLTVIPRPTFTRREWLQVAALGVLVVGLNQYPFLRGLEDTVPAHPSLIYALTPVLVMVLVCAWKRRWPKPLAVFGVVASFAGVIVLLRPWESDAAFAELRRGDLWICLALVMWAIYTVAATPLMRRHDPRTVTAWSLILGGVLFVPFGVSDFVALDLDAIPWRGWVGLAWMCCITSTVMMLLWNAMLRHLGPVQVAICANAQPVATALLAAALASAGWLSGDQDLGLLFWLGTVLVLAGVTLVQLRRDPGAPARTSPEDPRSNAPR